MNEEGVVGQAPVLRLERQEVGSGIAENDMRRGRRSIDPQAVQCRVVEKEGKGIAVAKLQIGSQISGNGMGFREEYLCRIGTAEEIGSDVPVEAKGIRAGHKDLVGGLQWRIKKSI